MHAKSTQMKGYSYHFSRSILANSPSNRLIHSNDTLTQINNNTNPTNHRYQLQDNIGQSNYATPRKEGHGGSSREDREDRQRKRNKNYQYSILPLEFKNHKNADTNRDFDGRPENHEGIGSRNRSLGDFFNCYDVNEKQKKPVNLTEQKSVEGQLRKEKEKRQLIQKSFDTLKLEHLKLLQKIKKLEGLIAEKDNQLIALRQIRNSQQNPKVNKDSVPQQIQMAEASKQLRIQSNLYSFLVQNLQTSFEKDSSKQLSRSTITCSYEDQYRQVLSIFSIEFNEDNFHEHLLKDIKKIMKRNEDYEKLVVIFKERQKEISKAANIMRKIQGQNSQLSQVVQYLNEQQQKILLTLSETIKEKQEMHLALLNKKYAQLEEAN